MKTILSKMARQELINIFEYSSKISSNYAIKTVRGIRGFIKELEHSPYLGRYVPEVSDKSLRELIYKSYRIVYEIFENSNIIYIHFIVNAKRDFNSIYKSYFKNNF